MSATGKRQQFLYFDSHSKALAAANNLRKHHDQFGRSLRFLEPARLAESVEVWDLLDRAATSGKAPFGHLRNLVIREIKAQKERAKSCSLNSLFDQYLEKLKRNGRTEHYMKAFKWCRGYFREVLEEPVSDLTAKDIAYAFEELSSGERNANLRLIRAVLNYGAKQGFLKSNPAVQVEFVRREKLEVKPLSNEIVRAMLNDAATSGDSPGIAPLSGNWLFLRLSRGRAF